MIHSGKPVAAAIPKWRGWLVAQPAIPREVAGDIIGSSPEVYAKLIRDEIERWTEVVRAAGIVVD